MTTSGDGTCPGCHANCAAGLRETIRMRFEWPPGIVTGHLATKARNGGGPIPELANPAASNDMA